jgi:hypothetical protein
MFPPRPRAVNSRHIALAASTIRNGSDASVIAGTGSEARGAEVAVVAAPCVYPLFDMSRPVGLSPQVA